MALVGYWLFGLPAGAWLAFERGAGPSGLWWGLTIGLVFVAVLLVGRVRVRLWRRRLAAMPPADPDATEGQDNPEDQEVRGLPDSGAG